MRGPTRSNKVERVSSAAEPTGPRNPPSTPVLIFQIIKESAASPSNMEPLSALAIATATTPYLEQSLTVSRNLYEYFKGAKNSPELSKELRRESLLVSDVL